MTGSEQEQEGCDRHLGTVRCVCVSVCICVCMRTRVAGSYLHNLSVAMCGSSEHVLCALLRALACWCSFLWVCVLATHWVLSRILGGVPVQWQVIFTPAGFPGSLGLLNLLLCPAQPSPQAFCPCPSFYLEKVASPPLAVWMPRLWGRAW